jgi:NADPH:quinone reductase-like Zn-dependent oxidoreductase
MKAVRIHAFGDASVLRLEDVPMPVPNNDDLVVRVMASAVNPIEWKIRSGMMKQVLGRDLPVTFGWACAGIVEAVGPAVTTFHVGDEICAYPEFTRGGTHADFVLIGEAQAALKPCDLSFVQASAVPMTSQAAWTALQSADVRPGERVLIHGASGAVGHWLIQLAKDKGAYVIATASGQGCEDVRALGADQAIDYRTDRFEDVGNVDVVFDLIGAETQARSWAILGSGGRLVSTAMPPDKGNADAIGAKGSFVFTPPDGKVLAEIVGRLDAGKLKPLGAIREFPLAEAAEAHRLGETGKAGGKMALVPQQEQ